MIKLIKYINLQKHPNSKLHRVTNKIISTLANEIERTPSLSDDKKTYLKSELDTITAYVEKSDAYFAKMVEHYYAGVSNFATLNAHQLLIF